MSGESLTRHVRRLVAARKAVDAFAADAGQGERNRRQALVISALLGKLLHWVVEEPPPVVSDIEARRRADPDPAASSTAMRYGMFWATGQDRLNPGIAWLYPETMKEAHSVAVIATRAMLQMAFYLQAWQRTGLADADALQRLADGACEAYYRAQSRIEEELIRNAERAAQMPKGGERE